MSKTVKTLWSGFIIMFGGIFAGIWLHSFCFAIVVFCFLELLALIGDDIG